MRYDSVEVTKLRDMISTLRNEKNALQKERDLLSDSFKLLSNQFDDTNKIAMSQSVALEESISAFKAIFIHASDVVKVLRIVDNALIRITHLGEETK